MKNIYVLRGKKMKMKIIGIFVCLLMVSTIVLPVASLSDRHDIKATSYDANVPIWKVGDEWTYHYIESVTVDPAYSHLGDLTFKVMDDSGDSYILEATTRPKGAFDLGSFGLKTTRFISGTMRVQMRKADLGLQNFLEKFKGFLLVTIGPLTLPIPIQVMVNIYVEFDPTWVIMPFPLYDGKHGNLSGTEFVHINNYMHMFWGLVPALGPLNVSWPITPIPYTCSAEEITVEGRIFDVYNVSAEQMDGSRFVSYYAEEVGNVAKEVIYITAPKGKVRYSLILELKDWDFTP